MTGVKEERATGTKPLRYTVACPVCEKRAFDISELPDHLISVRLKCPNCNRIVQASLRASPMSGGMASGENQIR